MTNQSELRRNICGIATGVLWGKNFDELSPNERSRVNAMAKDLEAYITANYTANSEVERLLREARIEELTGLLSMQKNKPRRVLLKDAVNIAYSRVCELSDVKKLPRFEE